MFPANHIKKTAITYAGMTIASIMVLTMLVTYKPSTNLISKGFNQANEIMSLQSFISNCNFSFLDCEEVPQSVNPKLDVIGKSYDLNPKLLAVLGKIQFQTDELDQSLATNIAQKLKNVYKTYHLQGIPMVVDHPLLGTFKLDGFNQASYFVFRYLTDTQNTPESVKMALAPPNMFDGQVLGFRETYTSLFHQNSL